MSNVISPLHVQKLGAATLRFFKSPTVEPQLAWHVHDDLAACLGLPRDLRRHFRHALANGPFKGDIRTIATADGLVTIAPHYAAQGLIGAAIDVGCVNQNFEMEYAKAAVNAFNVITAAWPQMTSYEYMLYATKNTLEASK